MIATSRDGTRIVYDRIGEGPPLVIVLGAFNDRTTGGPLAAYLAAQFSVFCYDRRGKGASGDTAPYAVEREVEDLAALVRAAGGAAAVLGYSSGAALALKAAASEVPITRLALYDLPPAQPSEHVTQLAALVAVGQRGEAVEYFQRELVGLPEQVILRLRHAPFRPALEAMAHTLVYEASIMADAAHAAAFAANVHRPTLAIAAGAAPPIMREVAERLVTSLARGRALVLEGATHDLEPHKVGPVLQAFLGEADG